MELSLSVFATIIAVLTVIYWYATKNHNYWKNQNVPCLPNPIPFFGHYFTVITSLEHNCTFVNRVYNSVTTSMLGYYFLREPVLLVRDPELIKNVLVTNFASFRNNLFNVTAANDPVVASNPFFESKAQEWKDRRNHLVGNFTMKKLKQMTDLMEKVRWKQADVISKWMRDDVYECNLKDIFGHSVLNVFANAVFSIDDTKFMNDSEGTVFMDYAKPIFNTDKITAINQAIIIFLPKLAKFLRLRYVPKQTDMYFRKNITELVKQRLQQKNNPYDYLQISLDNGVGQDLDFIVSDVMDIYLDTFVTVSNILEHVFYYLSLDEKVQTKTRDHINSKLDGNPLDYNSLQKFDYLEQVINESLRLSTTLNVQMKKCTQEITLTGYDGLKAHLKPGHVVMIPCYAVHRDANYWPNPDKFDPDRFAPENQDKIKKFTFMPFGEGPRTCIGYKLAYVMVKMIAITLLTKYSVEYSPKTKTPLVIDPAIIFTHYKGGVWAKFRKLNKAD